MMWSTLFLVLAASATAMPAPDIKQPVVRLPLQRRHQQPALLDRTVPLKDINAAGRSPDTGYLVDVSLGTPSQKFSLLVDTGSAHMVLPGSDCNGQKCKTFNHTFDSGKSSSFSNTSQPTTITYGVGEIAGYWGEDTVTVDGHTVEKNTFLLATQIVNLNSEVAGDGILGLGWGSKDEGKYSHDSIWESLPERKFGVWLARRNETDEHGGSLTLGGFDDDVIDGDIDWVDTTPGKIGNITSGWWIPFQGITWGASKDGSPVGDKIDVDNAAALVDTGSSNCHGPKSVLDKIYMSVPGVKQFNGGGHQIRYSTTPEIAKTFTMTFHLGGKERAIRPEDLWQCGQFKDTCVSTWLAGKDGSSWIVGVSFLKNYYTAFRADPPSVGFANLSDDAGGSPKVGDSQKASSSESSSSTTTSSTTTSSSATTSSSTTTSSSATTSSSTSSTTDSSETKSQSSSTTCSAASSTTTSPSDDSTTTTSSTPSSTTSSTTTSTTASSSTSSDSEEASSSTTSESSTTSPSDDSSTTSSSSTTTSPATSATDDSSPSDDSDDSSQSDDSSPSDDSSSDDSSSSDATTTSTDDGSSPTGSSRRRRR